MVKLEKFQCKSKEGLPKDFQTYPTFIPSVIFEEFICSLKYCVVFLGHPVVT